MLHITFPFRACFVNDLTDPRVRGFTTITQRKSKQAAVGSAGKHVRSALIATHIHLIKKEK